MMLESVVFRFAGMVVLASLALAQVVHPGFLWLTAFAGFNMVLVSFTGFCPAISAFNKVRARIGGARH